MFNIRVSLFANTKKLENKIDTFHDKVIDAAMNTTPTSSAVTLKAISILTT